MYQCLIVDDEELARRLIKKHLDQLGDFEIVASCESAIEASKVLKNNHIDLMFLDIEMPVLRGIDFYQNLNNKPKVIFTTAYRDYALDGFELEAIDYLLKPITFARFFKAIEKFLSQLQDKPSIQKTAIASKREDFIFIRKNRKQIKVLLDDILYIESVKDYINIHLKDKSHLTKSSISGFEEELDNRFVRIHRSFIVNKDKITAYTKYDVEIDEIEIPIGESYKSLVQQSLSS